MDPEQMRFDFEARAAMMQDNLRTVTNFMQRITDEMPAKQELFERAQQGDIFAFANWLKDFEHDSQLFADLASVIRKHEHA